jgi:hypothetical protein
MKQSVRIISFCFLYLTTQLASAQNYVVVKPCKGIKLGGSLRVDPNAEVGDPKIEVPRDRNIDPKTKVPHEDNYLNLPLNAKVFRIEEPYDSYQYRVRYEGKLLYVSKGCLQKEGQPDTTSSVQDKLTKPLYTVRTASGQIIDVNKGIRFGWGGYLKVEAGADYEIRNMQVTVAHASTTLGSVNVNSGSADLSRWLTQTRPGDRIIINIKKVVRLNKASGKEDNVMVTGGIITIPIN